MAIKISDDLFKADNYLNTLIELETENEKSVAGFDDKTQSFNAWLNREIWDHDDEMIKADGWDLSVHDLNPVVMWTHDYNKRPLGNSQWTKRKMAIDPPGLLWRPSFTTETQEGIDTYKLYKARVLRAFSAGFKPKEIDKKTDKKGRPIYSKTLLLEGSAVPIPANFMSLTLALENDFVKSEMLRKSFDDMLSRTDTRLFQTDMTDNEFEYIEKSFGAVKERRKAVPKIDNFALEFTYEGKTYTGAEGLKLLNAYINPEYKPMQEKLEDFEKRLKHVEAKDTIDASEYEDEDEIDIELEDDLEIEITQDGEIEIDLEALVEVGD